MWFHARFFLRAGSNNFIFLSLLSGWNLNRKLHSLYSVAYSRILCSVNFLTCKFPKSTWISAKNQNLITRVPMLLICLILISCYFILYYYYYYYTSSEGYDVQFPRNASRTVSHGVEWNALRGRLTFPKCFSSEQETTGTDSVLFHGRSFVLDHGILSRDTRLECPGKEKKEREREREKRSSILHSVLSRRFSSEARSKTESFHVIFRGFSNRRIKRVAISRGGEILLFLVFDSFRGNFLVRARNQSSEFVRLLRYPSTESLHSSVPSRAFGLFFQTKFNPAYSAWNILQHAFNSDMPTCIYKI